MLSKYTIVTPPDIYPITLEEANEHLHLSGQDEYVTSLIATATGSIERYLKRSLITTEINAFSDCWEDCMQLPFPSLQSVESVHYFDINGQEITLDEKGFYWVVTTSAPGYIKRKFDACYPELQYGRPDAIKINYLAGYGDGAEDVPVQIRHAIKLLIANYYEHRGDIVIGPASVNRIPNFISDLIHDFRIYDF